MHIAHDRGVDAVHSGEHLIHERTFWIVVGALAFAALLFMLTLMSADQVLSSGYEFAPPFFAP